MYLLDVVKKLYDVEKETQKENEVKIIHITTQFKNSSIIQDPYTFLGS